MQSRINQAFSIQENASSANLFSMKNVNYEYEEGPKKVAVAMKEIENEIHREKFINHRKERWYTILLQILFPFTVAGLGMVGAGLLLDIFQYWPLFKEVNTIFTLVPSLLGLKGNLEMTLAARLSTQVNLGHVHNRDMVKKAVLGNMFLVQAQSIIIGLLAALVACLIDLIKNGHFESDHLLTLISSSITTASLASLLLGGIMIIVILISHKYKINPDNIATPIASSLGDVVTLVILASVGSVFYKYSLSIWLPIIAITFFLLLLPPLIFYCYKNELVRETLIHGWIPIISAMLISSVGGLILSEAVLLHETIAIFQPAVNGVGGNLVAILASRLSTVIHLTSNKGTYPEWAPKRFISYPFETFFGKSNPESTTAIVLASLIVPGHIVFFFIIFFVEAHTNIVFSVYLLIFYLICATIQCLLLLLFCYWLVIFIWKIGRNPDNDSIPFLTSVGDLIGIGLLFLCFVLVDALGYGEYRDSGVKNVTNSTTFYTWNNATNLSTTFL